MSEQSQIAPAEDQDPRAPATTVAEPSGALPADYRPGSRARVVGLLRALRPKQWIKNVLVAAAPGAAGVLTHGDVPGKVALAFVAFCMVSSATYLVNDVGDVEEDRRHPTKRQRPIASGLVSHRTALATAVMLVMGGFAVAATVRWGLLALLAGYLAVTIAYTFWL